MGLSVLTFSQRLVQGADDNGVDIDIHPANGIFVQLISEDTYIVGENRLALGYQRGAKKKFLRGVG